MLFSASSGTNSPRFRAPGTVKKFAIFVWLTFKPSHKWDGVIIQKLRATCYPQRILLYCDCIRNIRRLTSLYTRVGSGHALSAKFYSYAPASPRTTRDTLQCWRHIPSCCLSPAIPRFSAKKFESGGVSANFDKMTYFQS